MGILTQLYNKGLSKKRKTSKRIVFTRNTNYWLSDRVDNREPLFYKVYKSDIATTKKEKTKAYKNKMKKRYNEMKKRFW